MIENPPGMFDITDRVSRLNPGTGYREVDVQKFHAYSEECAVNNTCQAAYADQDGLFWGCPYTARVVALGHRHAHFCEHHEKAVKSGEIDMLDTATDPGAKAHLN